jgi:hypothetical protein
MQMLQARTRARRNFPKGELVSETRDGKNGNSKAGIMALATAAVAAWPIYDMATASETPSRMLAIL